MKISDLILQGRVPALTHEDMGQVITLLFPNLLTSEGATFPAYKSEIEHQYLVLLLVWWLYAQYEGKLSKWIISFSIPSTEQEGTAISPIFIYEDPKEQ